MNIVYKGYEIMKGSFANKWYILDGDDRLLSWHWSKEDCIDEIDKLLQLCIVGIQS